MTLLAEPLLRVEVADQYEVRDPVEIRAFVAARPHLVAFLEEAPRQIARFFPTAPLLLEYQLDPNDGSELLVLRIRTKQESRVALETLDQVLDA